MIATSVTDDNYRTNVSRSPPPVQTNPQHYRRISLVDHGPVGSSVDSHTPGVRRVPKGGARRSSSQGYGLSSPPTGGSGLPPGAVSGMSRLKASLKATSDRKLFVAQAPAQHNRYY
jgi:hypothetical protein